MISTRTSAWLLGMESWSRHQPISLVGWFGAGLVSLSIWTSAVLLIRAGVAGL